ncbi:hypothetical protein [Hydrogenimonas sp.]
MKRCFLLVPLLSLLLSFPLSANETGIKSGETCLFLIRFEPDVPQHRAESVLKRHDLELLHVYTTLSKASGSLIVSAQSQNCTAELEKSLADDPLIDSLQREGRKKPLVPTENRKGGEASFFSMAFGIFVLSTFIYISSLGF